MLVFFTTAQFSQKRNQDRHCLINQVQLLLFLKNINVNIELLLFATFIERNIFQNSFLLSQYQNLI